MKVTIEKKTDQLNYEDFLGGLTRIVTVTGVKAGTKEQQYDIGIEGDQRVWRPAVTVLKLLVAAWGDDATTWTGHRAELYGDPDIMFGRDRVGGIRVSRVSHIDKPLTVSLTETRGKRKAHTINPLPDAPEATAPTKSLATQVVDALEHYATTFNVTAVQLEDRLGKPTNDWNPDDLGALRTLSGEMSRGEKHVDGEFSTTPAAEPEGAGRG